MLSTLYHGTTKRLLARLNVDVARLPGPFHQLVEEQRRLGMTAREAAVVIATVLYSEYLRRVPRALTEGRRQRGAIAGLRRRLGWWRSSGKISDELFGWSMQTLDEASTFSAPADGVTATPED